LGRRSRIPHDKAGIPASYFCIKAFLETDLTADRKKIDVPTLVLHDDDDQIVPIVASALFSSKIIKNAKLVVYVGGRTACARLLRIG
jgi:non-heme chloroperoxidase